MLKTLTLIVSGLNPLRAGDEAGPARWPQLARLAGRGSVGKRPIEARQDALHAAILDALQLHDVADKYPSAAVIRTGLTGERAGGFWLRAQPIHFAAGLDRLTTVPLHGQARMSIAERNSLAPRFADHLQSTGFELHDGADGEWLLRSEAPLQVQTVTPEFAAANPAEHILPSGRDAAGLRRLMTELQMLLHEHPVNTQRQLRGLPALNAIWLHGEGMLSDVSAQALPAACGDDVYLRGVFRLHERPMQSQPADAASLLSRISGPTVAFIDAADVEALETKWLAPASRALMSGAIARLTVMFDGWQVVADRAAMFKLWRRDLQPANWAAC
ncbi:hypothetical protein GCM10011487_27850 [Steroidobacter agaridevorans]|uniref:Phosphoglycerate mutase n=2 Tax=Steroidobacter agaridevorans TaxID=2695856 RepID=A0A829YC46_9GAMM|nr:hypothetical protein GCM10011487_27850 [Steroidobacter agaridevorans]GFE87886.1 hypothetical protein GCM10011488_28400 [Steroidobacter agaridevorans]